MAKKDDATGRVRRVALSFSETESKLLEKEWKRRGGGLLLAPWLRHELLKMLTASN